MTAKEKHSFLLSLQSQVMDLIAETEKEIDPADATDVEVFELAEHAKDVLFMVEDRMNEIEVSAGV